MNYLQIIAILTGLIGHWFVSNQDVRGYYYWIIGNLATIYLQFKVELYGMVILFVIYTALSIYGIVKWKKIKRETK